MKKIEEIHIDNLDRLVGETPKKTLDNVAEIAGCSAAYLSQIRNKLPDSKTGTPKTMGKSIARRLEKGFKKPEGWMDTDHAEVQEIDPELSLVPMMDAKLSAGTGNIVFSIEEARRIAFRNDFLRQKRCKPENAMGFPITGDSMCDVGINDGGIAVLNRAITEPVKNKYYGMWIDGEYLIKEIVKRGDMFYAISHNEKKKHLYPDIPIDSADSGIIGQAFYCGFEL